MNLNELNIDNLRLEIAILLEDISKKETYARFKIPVIMTEDNVSHVSSFGSKNVINKRNANISGYSVNIENDIKLKVPLEYIYFYDGDIIPAGTKFIVAFIGGNVNDIKIIGRY